MTGGYAVVLGRTGKNFAAGMSGGIAYVLDVEHDLYKSINQELVSMEALEAKQDIEMLEQILKEHVEATDSPLAKDILDNFDDYLVHFKKIIPNDFKKIRQDMKDLEDKGFTSAEASLKAFRMAHPE